MDKFACVADVGVLTVLQLSEFAKAYLRVLNVVSPAGLKTEHVANLGHFLCGLTADQIRQIDPEVYQ